VSGALSPVHWLIIVGVLVLLFGAKKLPELARSVGQSARVFHTEMRQLSHESGPATAEPVEERRAAG
jgi:sec-independent protein translocase protein TatA